MEKVMVFGTFDIFHLGHRSFLKQAKKYGEYLIVVVARDETVLKVKKRETINKERERVRVIRKSKLADKVALGSRGNKYAIIKKYQPNVICLGYDQKFFADRLKENLEKFNLKNIKIIRLKSYRPEIYKSSKLK